MERVLVDPPPVIPAWRPKFGLLLLILALVSPHAPALAARKVLVGALADGTVLVGLFILGGEFWDKVGALFKHRATVEFATAR